MEIAFYVRILLTLILCYFIYFETGPATTFVVFLISVSIELISFWMREVNKVLDVLTSSDEPMGKNNEREEV